jgi:4-oxalocrotonate tautomerase
MPFIDVTIAEGRSPEQLRRLIHELTQAAHRALDIPLANVRVVLRETPKTHFAAADVTIAEREVTRAAGSASGTGPDFPRSAHEKSG